MFVIEWIYQIFSAVVPYFGQIECAQSVTCQNRTTDIFTNAVNISVIPRPRIYQTAYIVSFRWETPPNQFIYSAIFSYLAV